MTRSLLDRRSGANDTSVMTAHAAESPLSLDPLIAEAKRRTRRRRLFVVALLILVGAVTAAVAISTHPHAGGYMSVPWTRGQSTPMRYCQKPDYSGAFLAASAGVTCESAGIVESALTSRCYVHGSCDANSFRCLTYYAGRYGGTFEVYHHALCSDGSRRVVWDGG